MVARLITLSGQPVTIKDNQGGTSFEFSGTWKGQAFRLYDYSDGEAIHIGGEPDKLDVKGLRVALWKLVRMSVTPTPFQAKSDYYDKPWGYPIVNEDNDNNKKPDTAQTQ
jgi:hypothetical protein